MARPIHKGHVTHHQLQLATCPVPVNFNTSNMRNTAPAKPIPPDEADEFFDIIFCF